MLSKYGKSMHQLKIKLEKKICTYIIKLGRLNNILGRFWLSNHSTSAYWI